ncbi:hypothetical protein KZP23_14490 [Echinicola marina]|uniref:alginate O-acetyltransferase AlgX-related protein n=1 Tax=Echinicola marina TaxID=2859768 RepID=UPI001CF6E3CF|nr:hypothetical protein [Echinicola marina]UCS91931.1 hypothetical protein KZP23_14490 [Echinicola marina]
MKVFFKKIGLLMIPALLLGIVDVFVLPHTFWTYRFWEGISYHKDLLTYGKFYQSQSLVMCERGDLSDGVDSISYSLNEWITDEYGFRNDEFIGKPDIVLLGDSFVVGTGLDQSELLSKQLSRLFGDRIKVYNMAPVPLRTLDIMVKKGLIEKPDILVYEFVEEMFPEPFVPYLSGKYDAIKVPISAWVNASQINMIWDKLIRLHWVHYFQHKILDEKLQYPNIGDMYFYKGEAYRPFDENGRLQTLKSLKGYQEYCEQNGIELIVMPLPLKETVYFEDIQRPDLPQYLEGIHAGLDSLGIHHIKVLEAMLERGGEYYQKQDTHWNAEGVSLAAELLKNKIGLGPEGRLK